MKILITGVAGLLGSNLAKHLIEKGHYVIGVDDLSGGYEPNIPAKVKFYECDCASGDMAVIFEEHRPDIVYHFAAYAAEGLSPFIRTYNYQNNLVATANIVNQCINYDVVRLVFTSSMAVYGQGMPPFRERDIPNPVDPYGIAKFACEMDIRVAGKQHGLDWCIIRPHNVYGPGQNIWDKYRNVLGIWMRQHLSGEPLTIFGDGSQRRAFSYIGDMMEPFIHAGFSHKASKQIINLGGVKNTTIKEAAKCLIEVMGDGTIKHLEARHEVKQAYSSHKKSEDLLGFKDNTSLAEGLQKMWEWAKNQPPREPFKWDTYEVKKGIYSYWK